VERKLVKKILDWCIEFYGSSDFEKRPIKLRTYKKKDVNLRGQYNSGTATMLIFIGSHDTIIDLISTVIHEYTHYLQPIITAYDDLTKYFGLKEHPLERDANTIAIRDRWNCYKHLKLEDPSLKSQG